MEGEIMDGSKQEASTSAGAGVVSNKEKKKREDKFRRRDPRALENILKTCQAQDDGSKLETLSAKYNELYDEFRNSQNNLLSTERRSTALQRERDQLQTDQSKNVLARSRMENLCRELQRQNKLIKEDNIAKIREEEERRKEVAAKFQVTLSEVTQMMQESSEKNLKLRDDNIDMANKISTLCEQFERREDQLRKVTKQIDLEKQLSDAKISKARLEYEAVLEKFNAERELLNKEVEAMKVLLQKSNEECAQLQLHNKSLQDQIQLYMGKYEEFESTICKSTQVFDNFKVEIGKTNKQILTLEKEIKMWKDRYQKTTQTICEMTGIINYKDDHIATLERKVEQVTKLCRQIQLERLSYLQVLRLNGIEPCIEKKNDEPVLPVEIQDEKKFKKLKPQKPKLSAKDPLRQKEIKLAQLKEELYYIKKQCENELQKQKANAEESEPSLPSDDTLSFSSSFTSQDTSVDEMFQQVENEVCNLKINVQQIPTQVIAEEEMGSNLLEKLNTESQLAVGDNIKEIVPEMSLDKSQIENLVDGIFVENILGEKEHIQNLNEAQQIPSNETNKEIFSKILEQPTFANVSEIAEQQIPTQVTAEKEMGSNLLEKLNTESQLAVGDNIKEIVPEMSLDKSQIENLVDGIFVENILGEKEHIQNLNEAQQIPSNETNKEIFSKILEQPTFANVSEIAEQQIPTQVTAEKEMGSNLLEKLNTESQLAVGDNIKEIVPEMSLDKSQIENLVDGIFVENILGEKEHIQNLNEAQQIPSNETNKEIFSKILEQPTFANVSEIAEQQIPTQVTAEKEMGSNLLEKLNTESQLAVGDNIKEIVPEMSLDKSQIENLVDGIFVENILGEKEHIQNLNEAQQIPSNETNKEIFSKILEQPTFANVSEIAEQQIPTQVTAEKEMGSNLLEKLNTESQLAVGDNIKEIVPEMSLDKSQIENLVDGIFVENILGEKEHIQNLNEAQQIPSNETNKEIFSKILEQPTFANVSEIAEQQIPTQVTAEKEMGSNLLEKLNTESQLAVGDNIKEIVPEMSLDKSQIENLVDGIFVENILGEKEHIQNLNEAQQIPSNETNKEIFSKILEQPTFANVSEIAEQQIPTQVTAEKEMGSNLLEKLNTESQLAVGDNIKEIVPEMSLDKSQIENLVDGIFVENILGEKEHIQNLNEAQQIPSNETNKEIFSKILEQPTVANVSEIAEQDKQILETPVLKKTSNESQIISENVEIPKDLNIVENIKDIQLNESKIQDECKGDNTDGSSTKECANNK